jgi:hypothetical protein
MSIVIVGLSMIEGLIAMGIYNTLIVNIFGIAPISFSVACWLMYVCNLAIGISKR